MESLWMLAAARALIITGREQQLVSRLGGSPLGVGESIEAKGATRRGKTGDAARVGAMVERVAPFTWWRSMCLEKALAGKWMLRRRGIAGTMYVGMARQGGEFVAHAWLVGDGQTLTGADHRVYATLGAFREPAKFGRTQV